MVQSLFEPLKFYCTSIKANTLSSQINSGHHGADKSHLGIRVSTAQPHNFLGIDHENILYPHSPPHTYSPRAVVSYKNLTRIKTSKTLGRDLYSVKKIIVGKSLKVNTPHQVVIWFGFWLYVSVNSYGHVKWSVHLSTLFPVAV